MAKLNKTKNEEKMTLSFGSVLWPRAVSRVVSSIHFVVRAPPSVVSVFVDLQELYAFSTFLGKFASLAVCQHVAARAAPASTKSDRL